MTQAAIRRRFAVDYRVHTSGVAPDGKRENYVPGYVRGSEPWEWDRFWSFMISEAFLIRDSIYKGGEGRIEIEDLNDPGASPVVYKITGSYLDGFFMEPLT